MKIYLITFSSDEYHRDKLIKRIKARWNWARITSNTWCIRADIDISEIRDELRVDLNSNSRILVVDITGSSWSGVLPTEIFKWLKE